MSCARQRPCRCRSATRCTAGLEDDARRLSTHLLPRTGAYHEIWVDGEKVTPEEEPPDPLYGERYLPRKFKLGVAIPEDNTIDVLTNDLAIGRAVRGRFGRTPGRTTSRPATISSSACGHGMTHNKPETYPRLANAGRLHRAGDLLDAAAAVVRLHRDWGDRGNRRHAGSNTSLPSAAKMGPRAAVGRSRQAARTVPGQCPISPYPTISAGTGRVTASSFSVYRSPAAGSSMTNARDCAPRCETSSAGSAATPILMPSQDIILSEIDPVDRQAITDILRAHGVQLAEELLPVERWALACPALPSCGLALTEAERVRDDIVGAIAARLRAGASNMSGLSIRITGCPNGMRPALYRRYRHRRTG